MSYGDNEYGSIPYGDDSIFSKIIQVGKAIVQYISNLKTTGFISNRKKSLFGLPDDQNV